MIEIVRIAGIPVLVNQYLPADQCIMVNPKAAGIMSEMIDASLRGEDLVAFAQNNNVVEKLRGNAAILTNLAVKMREGRS